MAKPSANRIANLSLRGYDDSLNKGLGFLNGMLEDTDVRELHWNLLHEDLSLPTAVLYQDKLLQNLDWMQRFTTAYRMKLAPHGKTTMAPRLFEMQLKSGAWGITLATAQQTHVAYRHAVRRVLMANQLVGKQNMAIVSRLLEDATFDFYCLVDSAEQADLLGSFFAEQGQRLNVLLETGVMHGRTGVRDDAQLNTLLAALRRWTNTLSLRGVEIYEGVLNDEAAVRTFLEHAVNVTHRLLQEGRLTLPAILSGAGSSWYDVVADSFSAARFGNDVEIVLRPGCYITHDVGAYREAQSRIERSNPIAREMHSGLIPALHVWAYVQSIPERDKAIIGMGKRDAAFDAGFPTPALHYRPGSNLPKTAPGAWSVIKMMDQHAYMQIAPADDLRVGDMIGFDISHPCLTFDKWRALPMLDQAYDVVEILRTFF